VPLQGPAWLIARSGLDFFWDGNLELDTDFGVQYRNTRFWPRKFRMESPVSTAEVQA